MRNAPTQASRILAALREAAFDKHHPAGPGAWLSVSQIMRLGIAQYNARISELRRAGHQIVNFKEWSDADQCYHSWYRLTERNGDNAAS